jgi:sporulation protein YlmC with PRC-barrel domain
MRTTSPIACLLLATALVAPPALAQETQTNTTPQPAESQDAAANTNASSTACYDQIDSFTQQMNREGFWVTGWGNRYGTQPDAAANAQDTAMAPWSGVSADIRSPRAQIRELYGAAQVLAYQGDVEGCQYLLSVLQNTYSGYTTQLGEAGVQPEAISGWRQERIALAEPVTEMSGVGRMNLDDLTGTDVRNLEDESLGSVSDIIVDPATGEIDYAVVARGGFLGIGEDYVAVPWQQFRATAGLNTLVLNTTENAFAEAPTVDPDAFGDAGQLRQQNQMINDYWGQQNQAQS